MKLTRPSAASTFPRVSDRQTVSLVGLRFHARVGVLPHERELPQPVEIDVRVDRSTATAFDPADVLDYRALYDVASAAVAEPVGYLEAIAAGVAERLLAAHRADRVRVAVRKPHVALPGPLAYAEVVLERAAAARAR